MEILRKLNANTTIKVEASTQTGLFKALGDAEEIFGQSVCGKCDSANVAFRCRTAQENTFYEMHCRDCNASLSFGVHKATGNTLFPKLKDKQGNWLEHGGWTVWQGSQESF